MFANLSRNIVQDLINQRKDSILFRRVSRDKVIDYLDSPQKNEKQIRDLSNFLYANSSHYRRLCNYFSKLPTFNYTIIPYNLKAEYNEKQFLLNYKNIASLLNKFNFPYHLLRIFNICMYQDTFYGLYFETEDSFDIVALHPDFCKISSKVDSCLVFSLDFDYFTTREYLLDTYGETIRNMYYAYAGYRYKDANGRQKSVKGNANLRWQEPPNQICIKVNEDQLLYSFPPFAGIFPEILNLEDYKLLKKAETQLKNYKVLVMQIPVSKDDGHFLIDEELATKFYNQACKNVDPGVGIIISPMEVDKLDFHNSAATEANAVNEAEGTLWASAGSNGLLFGYGDKPSSSSLKLSISNDESIAFALLRQAENWINSYIKKLNLPYDFRVKFLDQSIYNQDDVCRRYKEAASYGVAGSRSLYAASIGLSPSDLLGVGELENALGFVDNWIPMQSSNTMSSDTGRPTNEEKGLPVEDGTEDGQEDDSNAER